MMLLTRLLLLLLVGLLSFQSFAQKLSGNTNQKSVMTPFDLEYIWGISDSLGISGQYHVEDLIFTGSEYWIAGDLTHDTIYSFDINRNFKSKFTVPNLPGSGPQIRRIRAMTNDENFVYILARYKNSLSGGAEIYFVDTATKNWVTFLILPSHLNFANVFVYDSALNSGNGGFWVGQNNKIYMVDMLANLMDSITLPPFHLIFGLVPDYKSFANPNLLLNISTISNQALISWYDLNSNTMTNYQYFILDDVTDGYYPASLNNLLIVDSQQNPGGKSLLAGIKLLKDTSSLVLSYELGIPPPRPAPLNDNICNAIELFYDSVAGTFDNINSTTEPNEPTGSCFGAPIDSTVWFYTVLTSAAIHVTTSPYSQNFWGWGDSQLALYTSSGGCNGNLTQVACYDDGAFGIAARVNAFGLTIGDTLWIQVDGKGPGPTRYFAMGVERRSSISRTFEAYGPGKFIALYDDEWTVAPGLSSGALGEDATVSGLQAYASNYSLHLFGQVNPVFQMGPDSSGIRKAGFHMYVPTGNSAYFSLYQNDSLSGNPISEIWFDNGGLGHSSLNNALFGFPHDTWFEVMYYLNLDQDSLQFWVNGLPVAASKLSVNGAVNRLGAFSFEPAMSNGLGSFFIDNMEYAPSLFPALPQDSLSAFSLLSPFNGKKIATLNQNQNLSFIWNKSTLSSPSIVSYTLLMDEAAGDFTNPIFSSSSNANGLDSLLNLDPLQIDSVLMGLGLAIGDTFEAIWTVEAISNALEKNALNGPFTITFIRTNSVGLASADFNRSIILFPNPAKDEFFIEGSDFDQIQIIDMLGKDHTEFVKLKQNKVLVKDLKAGLYLIKIRRGENEVIRKIVIE